MQKDVCIFKILIKIQSNDGDENSATSKKNNERYYQKETYLR